VRERTEGPLPTRRQLVGRKIAAPARYKKGTQKEGKNATLSTMSRRISRNERKIGSANIKSEGESINSPDGKNVVIEERL